MTNNLTDNTIYLTKKGYQKLIQKLESLKKKRPEIAQKIKEAKSLGDLSENAEYSSAREEQSQIEGQILELENLLKRVKIVNSKKNNGKIGIGTKVRLKISGVEKEVEIVGSTEADPEHGKISVESPLGKELINKKKNDIVKIKTPSGIKTVKILEIK